jgi:hypothetical protein
MATVRPPKPAASAKLDAFVEEQLDRARRRVRLLDVSSALLLFAAFTLVYTLAVGLIDRRLDLSSPVRQAAFAAFAVVGLVFLAVGVVRPLFRRVNPYYAARAVEGILPGAKNSLINWLDLHGEALPPAIRASLGQRAAKDLARADLEQAISGRRAVWLTALTALLAFILFGVLVTSGTGGFGTLLARTFAPFGSGATAQRTQLTIERPVNGDAVLGVGQSFTVAIRVEGRVPDPQKPDALKLLFRYRDGEPYEEQPLEPDSGDVWMTVLPPSRTYNGFWYKVTGGDAETPEFHVTVRSAALIERFDVTYHYRAYTGWPDQRTPNANLRALRGTEAELVVHTNRPIKSGRLEVETRDGKRNVPADLLPGDPQAMRARLVLDQDGQYRVWFTTTDDESNLAALPYTIRVDADELPKAELTSPGADVTLPANATLRLAGTASDDIGVKDVTLRLRTADGTALQPKPYRAEKSLRLGDQGYPKTVDYLEHVALERLKDEHGKPFAAAKGMVLEYWLEAADACDYPETHPPAQSKHFKVTLADPTADKQEQQKERDKAAKEQKKHDQAQDDKLKQEEQRRKEEAEAREKEQRAKDKAGEKPAEKPDQPKNEGDQDLQKQAEKTGRAIDQKDKNEQSERGKCDCKGAGDGKGNGKGDSQAGSRAQDQGDAKPAGQNGAGPEGAGKGEGTKQDGSGPGAGKPEGAGHADVSSADGKGKGNDDQQASASARPHGPPQPDKGDSKGAGKADAGQDASATKPHGEGSNGAREEAAAKGPGQERAGEANDKAAAKGDQPSVAKAAPKPGEAGGEPKGGEKGPGKPEGDVARAEGKSGGPEKSDSNGVAKGAPKDDPKKRDLASEMERKEREARQGTDKESAAADKWLQDLARNAGDKDVRDLAKKVLDDARKDRASSLGLPKEPPRGDPKDGPPCECKGGGDGKKTGSAKNGKSSGECKGEGMVQVPQGGGRNPGAGRNREPENMTAGRKEVLQGLQADEADPVPGDPEHRRRAGVLQIDDFTKIDKDILKELALTPEQWEAFKKAYADKLKRDEAEQLPGSRNDSLGSRGAKEVKADKNGNRGDRTGQGQVPPEWRDLFREYTRRQAEKK